jgi:cysteinyl-tRNA synthetase
MGFVLYNSLGRVKEPFEPLSDRKVGIYSCGMTVYDYAHIGNMSAYTMSDLLRRWLTYSGYKVTQVMNITDVGHLTSDADWGEDKMEVGAKREGKSPWEISEFFTAEFLKDMERMNILPPDIMCKATDEIAAMIDLVKRLEDNGLTYETSDGVYFDTSLYPDYGKLSGNTIDKLRAGARVEVNPEKRNPTDFALWKKAEEKHIMKWDSPWGIGRPGWHIECSAMSMKYLGDVFDIHTGGEDHLFPHHESEIAQSWGATGKIPARWWVHKRFLIVEGQKMSKSLGNYYRLQDVIDRGYDPLSFKFFVLGSHYRSRANFTWDALAAAENGLKGLRQFYAKLDRDKSFPDQMGMAETARRDFIKAMDDDLDTPAAFSAVFKLTHEVNRAGRGGGKEVADFLFDIDRVFGLELDRDTKETISDQVERLIQERNQARAAKDWARADEIRQTLGQMGVALEDTKDGTIWRKT